MAKMDMFALGVGGKPPRDDGPPRFGGSKAPEPSEPPMEGDADSDLTPDMLLYHGADSNCGSCSHFSAPTTCDRWSDPVEEGGWCRGWQSGGAEADLGGGLGDLLGGKGGGSELP